MAYERTRALMESRGLDDMDVCEILRTYAEELEQQEPGAKVSIATANSCADEFSTEDS